MLSPSPSHQGYSREHAFFLQLLGRARPEQSRTLEATAPQVDWRRLFRIAPPDLTAYLEYKIGELGLAGQCPAELLREAGRTRLATAARWLRLRFELQNLVREFRRHNVGCVILKGAVLAFMAYPDSSLRSVSDLDLLVRPENLAKALELIERAGFEFPKRFEFANPLIVKDFVVPGEEISLPFEKPGTQALIEVHTQLESAEPWFPVPTAEVWEHLEEADWNDLRMAVLDAHEFLFHLVLHLSRGHFFSLGLRPLLDVHLWVELQQRRLDWEWLREECVRRGYRDWMYLTLKIVRDSFSTGIPAEFFHAIGAPRRLEQLERLAYEQIWANHRLDSTVPPRLAITFAQPSVGQAVRSLLERIEPGKPFEGRTIPVLTASKTAARLPRFRSLFRDLKVKVPLYLRAWRNGSLAWSSLQQAARLVKGRDEIRDILMNRHEPGQQQNEMDR